MHVFSFYNHSFFVRQNNLFGCGNNQRGQLGIGTNINQYRIIHILPFAPECISTGENHSIFLHEKCIYGCGFNHHGQLGLGNFVDISNFVCIPLPHQCSVESIYCGGNYTMVKSKDGQLYGCGFNFFGQLGTGNNENQNVLTKIDIPNKHLTNVFCGGSHTILLFSDGTIYGCGNNMFGQLGIKTQKEYINFFIKIPVEKKVVDVSCGGMHTILIMEDGSIYGSGMNKNGQLGILKREDKISHFTPIVVPKNKIVKKVHSGYQHTIFLMDDEKLYATGCNKYGQLGTGSNIDKNKIVKVILPENKKVIGVTCGYHHTIIEFSDGTFYGCGYNHQGQLGSGNNSCNYLLTQVPLTITHKTPFENMFNKHDLKAPSIGWNKEVKSNLMKHFCNEINKNLECNEAIRVIGPSNVGKTIVSKVLTGEPMEIVRIGTSEVYYIQNKDDSKQKSLLTINPDDSAFYTLNPQYPIGIKMKDTVIWDCPSELKSDLIDPYQEVTNALFHNYYEKYTFKEKIIIVIEEYMLRSPCSRLIKLIELLAWNLNKNIENYENSIGIIVNLCDESKSTVMRLKQKILSISDHHPRLSEEGRKLLRIVANKVYKIDYASIVITDTKYQNSWTPKNDKSWSYSLDISNLTFTPVSRNHSNTYPLSKNARTTISWIISNISDDINKIIDATVEAMSNIDICLMNNDSNPLWKIRNIVEDWCEYIESPEKEDMNIYIPWLKDKEKWKDYYKLAIVNELVQSFNSDNNDTKYSNEIKRYYYCLWNIISATDDYNELTELKDLYQKYEKLFPFLLNTLTLLLEINSIKQKSEKETFGSAVEICRKNLRKWIKWFGEKILN